MKYVISSKQMESIIKKIIGPLRKEEHMGNVVFLNREDIPIFIKQEDSEVAYNLEFFHNLSNFLGLEYGREEMFFFNEILHKIAEENTGLEATLTF